MIPFGRCSQQRHGVLTECATEGAPGLSTPVVPSIKDVMEDSRCTQPTEAANGPSTCISHECWGVGVVGVGGPPSAAVIEARS